MLSALFNLAIVIITVKVMRAYLKDTEPKILFRFFTILSNLLCAFACLLVLVFRIIRNVPASVLVLKYVGTSCVTLTFLTVMFFLGPVVYGFKQVLSGPVLWSF